MKSNDIETLFHEKNYKESLYLVAMIDYLCRVNNFDLVSNTNDYAQLKLAIPEFLAHNIVEAKIRNVV